MAAGKPHYLVIPPTFAALLGMILLLLSSPWTSVSGGEIVLGTVYSCAHGFKGTVVVQNDFQVDIQGFSYDGKAPAAWFHAMLKGSPGVNTVNEYFTFAFPNRECGRLEVGKAYTNATITIWLPFSILIYETIGIFDYQTCTNLGHIRIPENLKPDPVQVIPSACEQPEFPKCSSEKTSNGQLTPSCPVA